MAAPSNSQALLDKLCELSQEKVAEVEDFIDFLRAKQLHEPRFLEGQLNAAAVAGHVTAPVPGCTRSSASDVPPVEIPGRPPSEIVIGDRR